ncbi:NAD-dependent malic enzyme [Formivibrio citricus]|uniref:NAD-dependent malic enzyme n=1 Tax=Formivibrio citricus TaxID=83765 RepID=A0A1I4YQG5_9NEIS|nr:NAD-dependent malic enzyme [Formivibrio citricus]SFN40254.1 NAD-dependent malic enzyme [Formivibrio citricus]
MNDAASALCMPVGLCAQQILNDPLLNKGTAFTQAERDALGLNGLLPARVETLQEQVERCMAELKALASDLDRHVYLRNLQDTNETLYYAVVSHDLEALLPVIYTPTVGAVCQQYNRLFLRPRGLFLRIDQKDELAQILANPRFDAVECIVVTDGERILGLGDLGVGGMGIPIGKLALYTVCGGIAPEKTLAIVLDTGTSNENCLADPLYLGLRHERVRGAAYDEFIEAFIQTVDKRWPKVLLQWEDFHRQNASRLCEKYRDRLCSFNDDIQGTAAVAVGVLLSAINVTGVPLTEQRIAVVGGGSAGIGISDLLCKTMMTMGLTEEAARSRFFIVDRFGLVTDQTPGLEPFQQKFTQCSQAIAGWTLDKPDFVGLMDVMRNAQPTVLVGVSGQAGIFTEAAIREMAAHVARPVVLPMSNPTSCIEAQPADVIRWSDGRAVVGTGSPFEPFEFQGKVHHFAQSNNSYIFPGIGLGVLAAGARRISDAMLIASALALAELSPAKNQEGAKLLPELTDMRKVSLHVAQAVARQARAEGLTENLSDAQFEERIKAYMWEPSYQSCRCAG